MQKGSIDLASFSFPSITVMPAEEHTATFTIGPISAGYGWTLFPALRTVLLSSLTGVAIVAFRPVTLCEVSERLEEIMLNLKNVVICSTETVDRPLLLTIDRRGQRRVTAADIECPPSLCILNPNTPIASLSSPQAHFSLTLLIDQGRGYCTSEMNAVKPYPPDMIVLDAQFSPVRRASFILQHKGNGEEVLFTVKTNGSLSPDRAFQEGASILQQVLLQFHASAQLDQSGHRRKPEHASDTIIPPEIYRFPLEVLELTKRSLNGLKRSGMTRVGQLLELDEHTLLHIRGIGPGSIGGMRDALQKHRCLP
jgi:DNA-directed RNA polymerase subunit alpha